MHLKHSKYVLLSSHMLKFQYQVFSYGCLEYDLFAWFTFKMCCFCGYSIRIFFPQYGIINLKIYNGIIRSNWIDRNGCNISLWSYSFLTVHIGYIFSAFVLFNFDHFPGKVSPQLIIHTVCAFRVVGFFSLAAIHRIHLKRPD